MMINDIETIVRKSQTLHDALLRVTAAFGQGKIQFLFYGFSVHLHGRDRNDALICHTHADQSLAEAFLAAGGTATDVVAMKMEETVEPYPIDIVGLAEEMRETRDFRLNFIEKILSLDVKTAWISTINEPWVGGYGVLNQAYRDRYAKPAIPVGKMRAFAHKFHEEARRHRLIAKELKLRASQVEVLSNVAMGKSAEDLAEKYGVSTRAIEKRLETIRHKLRARNTLEAIYKATIYGVLPSPTFED